MIESLVALFPTMLVLLATMRCAMVVDEVHEADIEAEQHEQMQRVHDDEHDEIDEIEVVDCATM